MSVNTRYLVLGDPPDDRAADQLRCSPITPRFWREIDRYGTDKIPVQKLL